MKVLEKISDFAGKWMAIIALLVAIIAMALPEPVHAILPTSWVNPLLGIVMFGMGMTLKLSDFKVVFTKPKAVITGILSQFIIMPLIAWVLCLVFQLPTELAVEAECLELLARFDSVYVAGLSMGGLLAIKLAAKLPVKKAAFISAPIFVQDKRAPLLAFLRFFIHYLPKHKKNYQELQKYCISYAKMPTKPLVSLFKMLNECKNKLLSEIKIPCLILQSKTEHTVQPRSAEYIYNKLATAAGRRLVWFEHSGHILTLDREHEAVFKEIADFFAE